MGRSYSVFPIDEDVATYLGEEGIRCQGRGRLPTLSELRMVLDSLDSCCVRYHTTEEGWDAEVEQADDIRVVIWAKDGGDPAAPAAFHFARGDAELAAFIMTRVARLCGPIAMCEHGMGVFAVVTCDSDPKKVAEAIS